MRIWDLPPRLLCRQHLLGEHNELHGLWTIISQGRSGYAHHPETMRWKGKLKALYARHELQVAEMLARGYRHMSPLDKRLATGRAKQDAKVESVASQKRLLQKKGCGCRV